MKNLLKQDTLKINVNTINDKKVVEVILNGKGMVFTIVNNESLFIELEKEIIEFINSVQEKTEVQKQEIPVEEEENKNKPVIEKKSADKGKAKSRAIVTEEKKKEEIKQSDIFNQRTNIQDTVKTESPLPLTGTPEEQSKVNQIIEEW